MKKALALLIAICLTVSLFTGCGSAPSATSSVESATATGNIELTWWGIT